MQLFLDCDGVLADFDTYVEPIVGEETNFAGVQRDVPGMWEKSTHTMTFTPSFP